MTPLDTLRPCQLAVLPPAQRWLIEGLWAHQGVGIVGGEPKCCKSFLALDIALAVACGAPCLRRYPVCNASSAANITTGPGWLTG